MAKRIKKVKTIVDTDKDLSLTEMEIFISEYFDFRRNIIVPNISWGLTKMHECDLFIIRKTGYVIEVEIKRSLADYKKDFTKKHAHIDKLNRIKDFYYAFPNKLYEKNKDVIDSMLPDHAGVLVVFGGGCVKELKSPKSNKSARKLNEKEINKVLQLGCMRIWSLKKKIAKIPE